MLQSWRRAALVANATWRHSAPVVRARQHATVASSSPYACQRDNHDLPQGYNAAVDVLREKEYPHMKNGVYLDHSGATIYPRSLVENVSRKMMSSLYGNPHSANEPARLSGEMVDAIRERALRFLGADPEKFDLVFVANATAAVKLVAECFRDLAAKTKDGGFWYGYHKDAHTSLVGVRELSAHADHHCFESDEAVRRWLAGDPNAPARRGRRHPKGLGLFAYPGQSNMTGRRLPLSWPGTLRRTRDLQNTYTLLDAAALAMTAPLRPVFEDPAAAPDFACLSFYKIFGFPDVGGLVVRRDSGHVLTLRRYFGGGTVAMISVFGGGSSELSSGENRRSVWHRSKAREPGYALHDALEDGTLPFHSILALGEAIDVHERLHGSQEAVSRHVTGLIARMYSRMASLRHANGAPVVKIYTEDGSGSEFGDPTRQGATIAFNLLDDDGGYIAYSDVERIANQHGIYVRSGGICCPGGLFTALQYEPWQLERAMSAGHHCGSDGISLIHSLPTGVVRASLGAMSTVQDVDTFISFLEEVFVEGRRAVHHHEEHGHHDYGVHHHHQSYVVDQPTKISCDVADLPVPAYAVSSASSPSLSTAADQQRAVAASA